MLRGSEKLCREEAIQGSIPGGAQCARHTSHIVINIYHVVFMTLLCHLEFCHVSVIEDLDACGSLHRFSPTDLYSLITGCQFSFVDVAESYFTD